mmetsp:Transcript_33564/g.62883  ORF Transcript_33564/g.62883 Transcript_33564/m.62883 type:complete len:322 (-) Transcript_33564:152-1117(-)
MKWRTAIFLPWAWALGLSGCFTSSHFQSLRPVRGGWGSGQRQTSRLPLRAGEAVDLEDLLIAFGRELWAASDELLEVSAALVSIPPSSNDRKYSPLGLGSAALSLRNAADNILDDEWESAMGELEVAAVSCEGYFPAAYMQGLVDLFAYEEPMPECEWRSASNSLRALSRNLNNIAEKFGDSSNMLAEGVRYAGERLRRASRLFSPGGFVMPPDPRFSRGDRGTWTSERTWNDNWGNFNGQARPPAPEEEAPPPGSPAARRLESVKQEVAEVGEGPRQRRALLRQLIRRLHPDQNKGKEAEVMPAFRYVQRLRSQEADQRR